MKCLYLQCGMGASGDMLLGALVSLLDKPDDFIDELNALGIPGVKVWMEPSVKCGITGTHVSVTVHGEEEESHDDHHHHHDHDHGNDHTHEHGHYHDRDHGHHHHHEHTHEHSGMHEIGHIIDHLPVSDTVKKNALAVYALIAQAESEVHGRPVDQVHFHEVGALDAVADIVGVCMLMERIGAEKIVCTPVTTGFGHVRCAHGVLPVPAPATAHILRGVPTLAGNVEGELCTPTGAALLKHFADEFKTSFPMTTEKIGYGMGKKDFPKANCLRAFLGEFEDGLPRIAELRCNLDDMTAEAIGHAMNVLMQQGALDAFTVPVFMKKNRTGTLVVCVCHEQDAEKFARLMLRHTTTRGVRKLVQERYTLTSRTETVETPFGSVRIKYSDGYGVHKSKPEYEDIARIADEKGCSIQEVMDMIAESLQ